MQKIVPFLWFDHQAEEAMHFYTGIFKDAKPGQVMRYGEAGPGPVGSVMWVTFTLRGQAFYALNGGPMYKFTPAVSFFIHCETQQEIDELWDKLSEGGTTQPCGWLTDKFGLSWQVVPTVMSRYLQDPNPAKSQSVMRAMMQMGKLDIAELTRAYESA